MLIKLSTRLVRELKREIAIIYPKVKSALLSEALARGLGFENSSVLVAKLLDAPRIAFVDDIAFIRHLSAKGVRLAAPRPMGVIYTGPEATSDHERPLLQAAVKVDAGTRAIPESPAENAILSLVRLYADTRNPSTYRLEGDLDLDRLSTLAADLDPPAFFFYLKKGAVAEWQVTDPIRVGFTDADGGSAATIWPTSAILTEFTFAGGIGDFGVHRLTPSLHVAASKAWERPCTSARERMIAVVDIVQRGVPIEPSSSKDGGYVLPWTRQLAIDQAIDRLCVSAQGRATLERIIADGLAAAAPLGETVLISRTTSLFRTALPSALWKAHSAGTNVSIDAIGKASTMEAMHAVAHDSDAPEHVRHSARNFLNSIPGYRLEKMPADQNPITFGLQLPLLRGLLKVLKTLGSGRDGVADGILAGEVNWKMAGIKAGDWDTSIFEKTDWPGIGHSPEKAEEEAKRAPRLVVNYGPGTNDSLLLWEGCNLANQKGAVRSDMTVDFVVMADDVLCQQFGALPDTKVQVSVVSSTDDIRDGLRSAHRRMPSVIVIKAPLDLVPMKDVYQMVANGHTVMLGVENERQEVLDGFQQAAGSQAWEELVKHGLVMLFPATG